MARGHPGYEGDTLVMRGHPGYEGTPWLQAIGIIFLDQIQVSGLKLQVALCALHFLPFTERAGLGIGIHLVNPQNIH